MQNLEKIVSAKVADTVFPVTSPISSRHALKAEDADFGTEVIVECIQSECKLLGSLVKFQEMPAVRDKESFGSSSSQLVIVVDDRIFELID